jgi:dephospho-CoA kinase
MHFVVGLTGLAGSGKGAASDYLVKKHKFVKLVFSDILKEEAKKRGLLENKNYEESKGILSKLGDQLRRESGKMEVLADMLVEKIKSTGLEKVVVDGFRAVEEVETFRNNFESFCLIFVDAEDSIRFQRRKKEDAEADIESFRQRDNRDINEKGLGKVVKMADFRVDNNSSFEELFKQMDSIMEKITC